LKDRTLTLVFLSFFGRKKILAFPNVEIREV